jgi:hypothetical protein
MGKCAVNLVVFNGEDFDYWKNRTHNYLLMSSLSCAIPIRGLLRLSLHIEILTIDSTKPSLRNLVNLWMIALLVLSSLSVGYVLVVHILILTMNVLNNFSMRLMILYGA